MVLNVGVLVCLKLFFQPRATFLPLGLLCHDFRRQQFWKRPRCVSEMLCLFFCWAVWLAKPERVGFTVPELVSPAVLRGLPQF